jgi:hypothetical protein
MVALWQFITLAVLIGALLIGASVFVRRLDCAKARSIEEALLAIRRSIDSTGARAAEVKPEVSGGRVDRGGYLTLRDLRQLSSPAIRPSSPNSIEVSESHAALPTNSGRQSPPTLRPPEEDSVAKKNREMALFLSNQRRRRRARLGY